MCISEFITWMPEAGAQHPETRQGVQINFLKQKRAAFPLRQRQRCKGAFLQKSSKKKNKQTFLKTYDLHLCTLLFLQCKTPKNAKSSKFFFRSTSWHRTALNKTVVIAATKRCQTSTPKNACLSSTHCFWHLLTCILCMVWRHVCFCNSVNSPTHDVLMPLSYLSLGNQNKKMCGTISNATSILTRDLQKNDSR